MHLLENTSLRLAAESDVRLIFDLGVRAVEGLWVIVVEHSGLSVMLAHDCDKVTNLLRLNNVVVAIDHVRLCAHSRHIINGLFASLGRVLRSLNREGVLRLVTRVITPISSLGLCLCHPFSLSATEVVVPPGTSSTEVVPVGVTVDWNGSNDGPEYPSHLPDHPYIGLSHVVRNVEHHNAIILL